MNNKYTMSRAEKIMSMVNGRTEEKISYSIMEEAVNHEIIFVNESDSINKVAWEDLQLEQERIKGSNNVDNAMEFTDESEKHGVAMLLELGHDITQENIQPVTESGENSEQIQSQNHIETDIIEETVYYIDNELVVGNKANTDVGEMGSVILEDVSEELETVTLSSQNEQEEHQLGEVDNGMNPGVAKDITGVMEQEVEEEDEEEEKDEETLDMPTDDGNKHRKKRNIKKRKNKHDRKTVAKLKAITKHPIRESCKEECRKKCSTLIPEERRRKIQQMYWALNSMDQRRFILNTCSRAAVKRRTMSGCSKRNMTFNYKLRNETGEQISVCKVFLLTTLGYHRKNDKVIFNVLHKSEPGSLTPKANLRGKNPPPNKIDRPLLLNHIETFHPTQSHYRREHAPHVRYLPDDITVKFMHNDFQSKHPQIECCYEAYRKILFEENIRFTKLGHEECEACAVMEMHNPEHSKENPNFECEVCRKWSAHDKKQKTARDLYKKHKETVYDSKKTICISADLEKVIMLPRMECFKKVLFTPRLVVYNETFVAVGEKQREVLPLSVMWHEAVRGRDKEEIISTFFQFFLHHRDIEHCMIWLDNCSSQNKNWAFMSFLIYIVNCSKVALQTVEVFYFEPGHTYMSADSFHHQVELSLKRQKKTCDFNDFVEAVQLANRKKVIAKAMEATDFYDFKDYSSVTKRNGNKKENEKILLCDIVYVKATRGSFDLNYKSDLESQTSKRLNFLKNEVYKKKEIPDPVRHETPRGVSNEKKKGIIDNLTDLMQINRREFWFNLPTSDE